MDYTSPVQRTIRHVTRRTTRSGHDYEIAYEHVRTYPSHLERFLALTKKGDDADDCWQWIGTIEKRTGYGRFRLGGRTELAHRASYRMHVGEIPPGKYLDHLCRVRNCVNPAHLEPVTAQVNTDRGLAAKKDECSKGHPMKGDNLGVRSDGRRYCKACSRLRSAKHYGKV
ncbi:MAG TPA: HNH endonuclease signature motif containing protein [Terrimesophilobacter sp.]|nr:HNH endonuclease signature motif containing protein [Terrimesophilobacter sp.]